MLCLSLHRDGQMDEQRSPSSSRAACAEADAAAWPVIVRGVCSSSADMATGWGVGPCFDFGFVLGLGLVGLGFVLLVWMLLV